MKILFVIGAGRRLGNVVKEKFGREDFKVMLNR